MKTLAIIFMVLTFISIILINIFRKKENIFKMCFYISSILYLIFSFIFPLGGLNLNYLLSLIFALIGIIFYVVKDFLKDHIASIKKYDVIFNLVFYLIISTSEMLILGFNFLELIIFSIFAIIFFSTSYLYKRNEPSNAVSYFFIYTIFISFLFSIPVTGILMKSTDSSLIVYSILLTISSIFMFLYASLYDANVIFKSKPSNVKDIIYTIFKTFNYISVAFIPISFIFII